MIDVIMLTTWPFKVISTPCALCLLVKDKETAGKQTNDLNAPVHNITLCDNFNIVGCLRYSIVTIDITP